MVTETKGWSAKENNQGRVERALRQHRVINYIKAGDESRGGRNEKREMGLGFGT